MKGPLNPGTIIPSRSFIWDVRTWKAAAVVKPDTNISDKNTLKEPNWRMPNNVCKVKAVKKITLT